MAKVAVAVGLVCGGMFFLGGPMGVILIGASLIAFGVSNKVKEE